MLGIRVVCTPLVNDLPFSTRDGTCIILSLARLFDSLVRVSRRVEAPHSLRQDLSITEKSSLTKLKGFYSLNLDDYTLLPLA